MYCKKRHCQSSPLNWIKLVQLVISCFIKLVSSQQHTFFYHHHIVAILTIFFCQIKGSFQNYQFEINRSRYKTICFDKTTFSDVSGQLVKLDWISEKSTQQQCRAMQLELHTQQHLAMQLDLYTQIVHIAAPTITTVPCMCNCKHTLLQQLHIYSNSAIT